MKSKRIYVDCTRGLASDMIVGALLDCFDDKETILHELNVNMNNNMTLTADFGESYGRKGILFKAVDNDYNPHEHHHEHRNLKDVHAFIDATAFSDNVKKSAKGVYEIIAEAEAEVHGASSDTVHFHEVGSKRAIACILCACALFDMLNSDEIIFSEINTGFGKVVCAHGEVDVPAPATKVILSGIPNFTDNLSGELCTPTGTALAKFFADSYILQSAIPQAQSGAERMAVGLGRRDIGVANGVRLFLK